MIGLSHSGLLIFVYGADVSSGSPNALLAYAPQAAVEDDPGQRYLCGAFFKCRCRILSFRRTGREEEKCAGRSCDRCNRASNRGGV